MPLDIEKIRRLREKLGLTLQEAAKKAGMGAYQRWQEIEGGKSDPRVTSAEKVAAALGVKVDDILL